MRKTAFCMCENKDAYQLCNNCTADKYLCFAPWRVPNPFSEPSSVTLYADWRLVSDLVGNPKAKDQLSGVA